MKVLSSRRRRSHLRGLIPSALVLADDRADRTRKRRIAAEIRSTLVRVGSPWRTGRHSAGTSTGVLACASRGADGRPLFTAEELAGIYVEEGPRIFHRGLIKRLFSAGGWIDERYEDDGLEHALARYLGDACLSEALVADLRHRLRHPRPLRVLLPLRARRARPDVRLPAHRRGPRDVRRAELLRARGGDRPRRRAHVPARSTAGSTPSTRRCAPTPTSSATAPRPGWS